MQQQGEPGPGELQQQPQATSMADTPQIVQPTECGICLSVYDLERRPRCLPCGHTYCSTCLSALLQDGHLICPSCRTHHHAHEINHFHICYAVEDMVMATRTHQVEAAPQTTGEVSHASLKGSQATGAKTKRRATVGLSRKLRSMIQEQKVSIESLETTLQKELQQLSQYRVKLAKSLVEHEHLLKELDKVVQQHQANMKLLQEEDDRVEVFIGEGEEVQRELMATQGHLDKISTAQEAITTIDAADHTVVEVEEWLQHSREEIPNGTVISTSFRILEATKAALKVITEETETIPDQAASGHMNCTVMETIEINEAVPVEFKDLRKVLELRPGRVFATEKYADGTCYSSKVIYKEDKVYLHTLKNVSPPRYVFTLKVSNALENFNYTSTSVFLDLVWPGKTAQRVYIQLVADTPLTRQFVALCLGHTGLTYCNTNLVKMISHNGMKIVGVGDITKQKAAAKLALPPIPGNNLGNKVGISAGMVMTNTDLSNDSEFGIVMSNCRDNHFINPSCYHLGSVKFEGLNILEEAIKNVSPLTQVRVVDCGVMY